MKIGAMLVLACATSWAVAANVDHEDDPNLAIASGVTKMAAQFNELALACKHKSNQEIEFAKSKQRSAALTDMKISAADYDRIYAASTLEFKKKWQTLPAQEQKKTCDQMKARSQQGR